MKVTGARLILCFVSLLIAAPAFATENATENIVKKTERPRLKTDLRINRDSTPSVPATTSKPAKPISTAPHPAAPASASPTYAAPVKSSPAKTTPAVTTPATRTSSPDISSTEPSPLKTSIQNIADLVHASGIASDLRSRSRTSLKTMRVAVLDVGFKGYEKEIGQSLPTNTVYHAGPTKPPETEEVHGLAMAQIFTAVVTNGGRSDRIPFEIHLFPTNSYSNLEAAINTIVDAKNSAAPFDVVLYAQIWTYGGNGDGRGFINALVNRALDAGVIWVNAAGNFGKTVYRAPIRRTKDDWADLPGPNKSVRIRCHKNPTGSCPMRLTLSWNEFQDDVNFGTDKDLDLILTDDTLNIIQTAGLKQEKDLKGDVPGHSLYPREIIQVTLKPGVYFARVKVRSQNFVSGDELTLAAAGDSLEFLDRTEDETLLNPADNARVLTIGASDADDSSQSVTLGKPDFSISSLVDLGDKQLFKGTSNAAAIVTASVAVIKSQKPKLTRDEFLRIIRERTDDYGRGQDYDRAQDGDENRDEPDYLSDTIDPIDEIDYDGNAGGALAPRGEGRGFPMQILNFGPTGPGCFLDAALPVNWSHLQPLLRDGGRPVQTTAGVKIMVGIDPLQFISGLIRRRNEDMVVADQHGYTLQPRSAQYALMSRATAVEIVELPLGVRMCDNRRSRRR